MRAVDIIIKKRSGESLDKKEIDFMINGYVDQSIPEYQVSSLLMAIFFQGMESKEIANLTEAMINSGTVIDLKDLTGPLVDKHSTGGVGDKVSLLLAPIVAAMGIQVPMISGRSLGHTGGTLDKLESMKGYRTGLSPQEFHDIILKGGFAMSSQSKEIVPADRLLYALRDVTGTVESIPLITASIMSKKFAEGAESLVFDVKFGSGAFMKKLENARELATSLVNTGKGLGRNIQALLTDMNQPLGTMVGNFLEVEESYLCLNPSNGLWDYRFENDDLRFTGPSWDLMDITVQLAAAMAQVGGLVKNKKEALEKVIEVLENGSATDFFERNVSYQSGDMDWVKKSLGSYRAAEQFEIKADIDGYVNNYDAYPFGMAGVFLGAGRDKVEDAVKFDVGIELLKKPGDEVKKGESMIRIYASDRDSLEKAKETLLPAIILGTEKAAQKDTLVHEVM